MEKGLNREGGLSFLVKRSVRLQRKRKKPYWSYG